MKTTDLFNKKSHKLNEAIDKVFGQKMNFTKFSTPQLEDARNRLRTQLSQTRNESKFNETVENETYTKAQWMLDAIVAELAERNEVIVDSTEISEEPVEETQDTEQGQEMKNVNESAADKAGAVVVAKDMTDKVGRWIEELSGMENDTLLSLGDTIRDEMGQEEAKRYLEAVAPAIQQALQNLRQTRETLASGMRALTGEEQSAEMIGSEPEEGGDDDMAALAEPDAMNAEPAAAPEDDFAAADAASGGEEAAGREQRESINYQSRLLKVLAG
jgi:hypothetical protein